MSGGLFALTPTEAQRLLDCTDWCMDEPLNEEDELLRAVVSRLRVWLARHEEAD